MSTELGLPSHMAVLLYIEVQLYKIVLGEKHSSKVKGLYSILRARSL